MTTPDKEAQGDAQELSPLYTWLAKNARCGLPAVEQAARVLMDYYEGAEAPAAPSAPSAPLDELLGQYWDLAYSEGSTGTSRGSEAQAVLNAIRRHFPAAPAQLPGAATDTYRKELLQLAEQCGMRMTGKPDASEPIEMVFSIDAWRKFDVATRGEQRPELTVWTGAMPESNGKSNFTAVLMRKGTSLLEGISEGLTIARSEYPDRVRYEADCVRHLMGELADKPFIADYDASKYSGYEPPALPAAQPSAEQARDAVLAEAEEACEDVIRDKECDAEEQSGAYACRDAVRKLRTTAACSGPETGQ